MPPAPQNWADYNHCMASDQPHLRMAVSHLNTSVGACITAEQLSQAMRHGTAAALNDRKAAALASSVFTELSPQMIVLASHEAQASMPQIQALYQESLSLHHPRVLDWERVVAQWL